MIHAVVLAAGLGRRFGPEQKLTAPLRGRPVIRWTVEALLESRADDVWVVVEPEEGGVREALAGFPVRFVDNPRPRDGMSASLRLGVEALPDHVRAALVVLGDQPYLRVAAVDRVIETFEEGEAEVVVPVYAGVRGHPVLFGRALFSEIAEVSGDQGAREVVEREPERVREVVFDFPAPVDVDFPADLVRLTEEGPPDVR